MKWHRLVFRVVPQVSTAASGGYVAAFFPDPTDRISSTQHGLSKMTSQMGARTCKWWETANVVPKLGRDLLYTSFTPEEPRLGSPGKFVLACDSVSTQSGGLTVYVDWDVELSIPSLEGAAEEESGIPSLQCDLWTLAGKNMIYSMPVAGDTSKLEADARRALPGILPGTHFRMSSPRYFGENQGGAFVGITGFDRIYVDTNFRMWPSTSVRDRDDTLSSDTNLIASKNENVEFVSNSVFLVGWRSLCHVPTWWKSKIPLVDASAPSRCREQLQSANEKSPSISSKRSEMGSKESLDSDTSFLELELQKALSQVQLSLSSS